MKIKRRNKTGALPFFSASDIAFLLLIFVMLVTLINYRTSIDIDYAEINNPLRIENKKSIDIWIDRNGNYFLNGNLYSLNNITNEIIGISIEEPLTRIHIAADRDSSFKNINNIIQILQNLQYRYVSFIVRASSYE